MAKEHQPRKSKSYLLPHNLYMRMLYIIRDYDRLKDEYHDMANISARRLTDKISGSEISKHTENRAIKRTQILEELEAIEQALIKIPQEYRQGIKHNIIYRSWFPGDAGISTYRRWKQRFIYYVAENLNYI